MTRDDSSPPNFDRVAKPYRWMEYLTLGRSLERCRNYFLPQLAECRSALVLGDGDGRFLAYLLATNSELHADAVDTSAAMLHLLEHRADVINAQTRLQTHTVSALNFTPQRNYDLIVTHFFLDCLTQHELDALCSRIAPHIQPKTLWLVSDFRIPAGVMRLPARMIIRMLYLAFRLLTGLRTAALPNYATALTTAGFSQIAQHRSLAGLLATELWEYTPAMLPPQRVPPIPDPVPDPEPASPSLPWPDPGVFHPDPAQKTPPDVCPPNE